MRLTSDSQKFIDEAPKQITKGSHSKNSFETVTPTRRRRTRAERIQEKELSRSPISRGKFENDDIDIEHGKVTVLSQYETVPLT